jgi:hypothetical protein
MLGPQLFAKDWRMYFCMHAMYLGLRAATFGYLPHDVRL